MECRGAGTQPEGHVEDPRSVCILAEIGKAILLSADEERLSLRPEYEDLMVANRED